MAQAAAANNILGVVPEAERDGTMLITQEKFKSLIFENRTRYGFLTPEFIEEFCKKIIWIADPVENHPSFFEFYIHIDLLSYARNRRIYVRIVNFLNRLKEKQIYGYKFFRCGKYYNDGHYYMMRLNLVAFHFFDLRFEPRPID